MVKGPQSARLHDVTLFNCLMGCCREPGGAISRNMSGVSTWCVVRQAWLLIKYASVVHLSHTCSAETTCHRCCLHLQGPQGETFRTAIADCELGTLMLHTVARHTLPRGSIRYVCTLGCQSGHAALLPLPSPGPGPAARCADLHSLTPLSSP